MEELYTLKNFHDKYPSMHNNLQALRFEVAKRDENVVVYFSLRPYSATDPIYEILDENMEVTQSMNFDDLKALNEEYSS